MMKKILTLLALSALVFLSCKKEKQPEPPAEPDALEMATTSFTVDNGEGTIEIPASANVKLSVTVADDSKDWLSFVQTKAMTEYKVVIGYKANPTAKERSGRVTITANSLKEVVAITQAAGAAVVEVADTARVVNPRGETISVAFTSNDDVTVSPSASWITVKDVKDGAQELEIAVNDTGSPREGEVVFAAKSDANVKDVVVIRQNAANVDPNAIHILSIGNDFSTASLVYLPKVLQNLGYTTINVVDVNFDNNDIETIAADVANKEKEFACTYAKDGVMETADTCAAVLLAGREWDYVVIQQTENKAADAASYAALDALIDSIRTICPFSPIAFDMGYAYKGEAEDYEAIADVMATTISANKKISKIIPVGTTIQNMRTSFMGDNMTGSNGKDLSVNIGRPLAAYTWAKVLSGKSIDSITYVPDDLNDKGDANRFQYESYYLPAMIEAVNNAVATPYKVTETKTYAPAVSAVDMAALKAGMAALGYPEAMLNNFVELPMVMIPDAFYNSSGSFGGTVAAASPSNLCAGFTGSVGATQKNFMATPIFTHDQLPVGSMIVLLDNTLQYRPEGWVSLSTVNDGKNGHPSRPGNVKTPVVLVDDAWWGSFKYRALNISKVAGGAMTQADWAKALKGIAIFVPKTALGNGLEDYGNGNWNW